MGGWRLESKLAIAYNAMYSARFRELGDASRTGQALALARRAAACK